MCALHTCCVFMVVCCVLFLVCLYICVCVYLQIQGPLRECRSIRPGASGLPYYCTPLVCIPVVIGLRAMWRHNKPTTKTNRADQLVLKRRELPGFAIVNWKNPPASLGYPLSVFNKNSTLKRTPSVCVPDVIGALSCWFQTKEKKTYILLYHVHIQKVNFCVCLSHPMRALLTHVLIRILSHVNTCSHVGVYNMCGNTIRITWIHNDIYKET